jgi:ADP-heptose:LPS heptosyltransferase
MAIGLKERLLKNFEIIRSNSAESMDHWRGSLLNIADQTISSLRGPGDSEKLRERPNKKTELPQQSSCPVVLFYNGKGDHILALPALRALAALFRERLTLVCRHGAHQVFFPELQLGRVLETRFWPNKDTGHLFDAKQVADAVGECDLFLSLVPWHSDAMAELLRYLAPTFSVGFHSDFQTPLQVDHTRHAADAAFLVPSYLSPSLRLEDYWFTPKFTVFARDAARELRALMPTSMRVLAVHAETDPSKMWAPERLTAFLDAFLAQHPDFVAWIIGMADQGLDKGRFGDRVIPCCRIPIAIAFSLVTEADYFLGIDSCMLHVADLCGVPAVGLFGPTSSSFWGLRHSVHRHVHGDGSMHTISVENVCDALNAILASDKHTSKGNKSSQ